jgi:hypothetical protein
VQPRISEVAHPPPVHAKEQAVNEPVTTEHPSVKKDFGARAALWELRGID